MESCYENEKKSKISGRLEFENDWLTGKNLFQVEKKNTIEGERGWQCGEKVFKTSCLTPYFLCQVSLAWAFPRLAPVEQIFFALWLAHLILRDKVLKLTKEL